MEFSPQFSIGDRVRLTIKGAAEHRRHNGNKAVVGAAVITAATGGMAAPAVLGTAVGVAGGFGALAAAFGGGPETGIIGQVVAKKDRWMQPGHDYEMLWDYGIKS